MSRHRAWCQPAHPLTDPTAFLDAGLREWEADVRRLHREAQNKLHPRTGQRGFQHRCPDCKRVWNAVQLGESFPLTGRPCPCRFGV